MTSPTEHLISNIHINFCYLGIFFSTTLTGAIGAIGILFVSWLLICAAKLFGFETEWFFVALNTLSGISSLLIFIIFTAIGVITMFDDTKKLYFEILEARKKKGRYNTDYDTNLNDSKDIGIDTEIRKEV